MVGTKRYKAIIFTLFLLIYWNGLSSGGQSPGLTNKEESKRERAIREQENGEAKRREALYKEMIKQKTSEAETFIEVAERLIKEEGNPDAGELLKAAKEQKHAGLEFALKKEYEKALKSLKESYLLAVQAVKSIRQDKTVTHKIIFETPKDEFAYEKDKNEIYLKLYSQIIYDGNDEVKRLFDEAKKRREKAEDAYHKEKYAEAVEKMRGSNDLFESILEMIVHPR